MGATVYRDDDEVDHVPDHGGPREARHGGDEGHHHGRTGGDGRDREAEPHHVGEPLRLRDPGQGDVSGFVTVPEAAAGAMAAMAHPVSVQAFPKTQVAADGAIRATGR